MQLIDFNGIIIKTVDQAAQLAESFIREKQLGGRKARRCFAITIELIQNLLTYSKGPNKAILKICIKDNLYVDLTSTNYTDEFHRKRLEKKINQLRNESDHRQSFRKKLSSKVETDSLASGDFGLDLCFRFSRDCLFKISPAKNGMEIIQLQFIVD